MWGTDMTDIPGYRKLIVTLFAILSASVLVGLRLISDGIYSTVMLASVGGYLAANVTQAISTTKKEPAP